MPPVWQNGSSNSRAGWLRARAEPGTGNIYAEWLRLKNEAYYEDGRKRLLAMFPENGRAIAPPLSQHAKDSIWRVATDERPRPPPTHTDTATN